MLAAAALLLIFSSLECDHIHMTAINGVVLCGTGGALAVVFARVCATRYSAISAHAYSTAAVVVIFVTLTRIVKSVVTGHGPVSHSGVEESCYGTLSIKRYCTSSTDQPTRPAHVAVLA